MYDLVRGQPKVKEVHGKAGQMQRWTLVMSTSVLTGL